MADTRLFKVVLLYQRADTGEQSNVPEVKEVCIIRETPKFYMCVADWTSGFSSRIAKHNHSYSTTPEEAWAKYLARAGAMLKSLHLQRAVALRRRSHAKAARGLGA